MRSATLILNAAILALVAAGCSIVTDSDTPRATDPVPQDPTVTEPSDLLQVDKVVVGKLAYFDTTLSTPAGQSCASCHSPDTGFAEPHASLPVSQGVLSWLVGNRNAPTAAYAAFSPEFHFDEMELTYVGGQFWDGRAATLADQAKGPFLNPLEMHNAGKGDVIAAIKASDYAGLFERAFGEGALDDVEKAYDQLAEAIAAYEQSSEVVRFSSKYDAYIRGEATLSDAEARGLELFESTKARCSDCHTTTPLADGTPALFTDFTYDNLGVPRNPSNPFYALPAEHNPDGATYVDLGLGGALGDAAENGKMKVPTLRNIGLTAPYMHNGVFATLREVVMFYNTRDTDPAWGPPEVDEHVNVEELGNLGLTEQEVDDLVAFMLTLDDGWVSPGGP